MQYDFQISLKAYKNLVINDKRQDYPEFLEIANKICEPDTDRKELAKEILNYMIRPLTKDTKKGNGTPINDYRSYFDSANFIETILYAVKTFDLNKCNDDNCIVNKENAGRFLGYYINSLLKKRYSNIFYGDAGDEHKKWEREKDKIIREIYNLKKAFEKKYIGQQWEDLSGTQQEKIAKEFGYSKETLDKYYSYNNINNPQSLFCKNEDGEEFLLDVVPSDKNQTDIVSLEIYAMFSYVIKNAPEKKRETFFMIDTNMLKNADIEVKDFKQFIHLDYLKYAQAYRKFIDKDIICYKWFDGKRPEDKEIDLTLFKSKKSSFSTTYRTPYNNLCKMYLKRKDD